MKPKRWHLYIVDLEPRIGSKPGKQRPCLVVQPTEFGEAGLNSSVILPITTKIFKKDAFPLRVRLPKGTAGVLKDCDLMIDQILAWDHALFGDEIGVLPEALQDAVKAALKDFFDL
jgi:mRNA interferase MazF